ncbi:MAG: 5-methylthioadenosine/S-adenosylhomocysteine deaminase [Blastocatellia bacterium]|jgi:5-methylthioadenosine/S-adenosylhomocysteine deaminase|nr:5-methylthioadenosine/S-adenosylhomocysteine deaminase [Blastocatellia bacterium]
MSESILIKGGTLLTMDGEDSVVNGDLYIRDGRIEGVGKATGAADVIIDAGGCAVLPGFVQTHLHLCQTLFRGTADDMPLLDWLRTRVWPMEAAHSPTSIRASAQLAIAELIKGGTTCALTMETVSHTGEVFRVVDETGFRATVGKCMMDKGEELPPGLQENADDSVRESLALLDAWHEKANGRIRYCFAPRFAISCSKELLTNVARLARERGVMIHTHASENRTECELIERETGQRNVSYLDALGISGPHVLLAHCVHLDDAELGTLAQSKTHVAHCPSSNLKLGSGIAEVSKMLERGISVSLGADGAACNNRLDMFTEMRTAALLQKVLISPDVLPATRVLRMATIDGAAALGLRSEIGSLEPGKRADVIVVGLKELHNSPAPRDLMSTIVYSAVAADVETVIIDGKLVMRDRELLTLDESSVLENAEAESKLLLQRAGISF